MGRFACRLHGGRFRRASAAALAALGALAGASHARGAPCTIIALVLSIDASSSVDDRDFLLEKRGLADALRDANVQASLLSGGPAKVTALFWGDDAFGTVNIGWHIVRDASDAEEVADETESVPRTIAGNTDIGSGLDAALDLLERPEACARRLIVNITGDGRETVIPRVRNRKVSLPLARMRAKEMGVTVNGLAIADDEPNLAQYYRKQVIAGPGAFVMQIRRVEDYAAAIREKIIRETQVVLASNGE